MTSRWPPVPSVIAAKPSKRVPEKRFLRPKPEKTYRPHIPTPKEASELLIRSRAELAAQIQAAIAERATAPLLRISPLEMEKFLGNV